MVFLGLAVLLLLVAFVIVCGRASHDSTVAPEDELRAAVELHAINRRLDVAWLRHQSRVAALRARRALGADLDQFDNEPEDEPERGA
jgi:photosystem II stability/assembly factor-like uncharacterized protein